MSSPILRVLGAIRQGTQAVGEMREAAAHGRCINCKIRRTEGEAKLCDVCGEQAATAGVNFLANVIESGAPVAGQVAHETLRDFFTGKR